MVENFALSKKDFRKYLSRYIFLNRRKFIIMKNLFFLFGKKSKVFAESNFDHYSQKATPKRKIMSDNNNKFICEERGKSRDY